MSSAGPINNFQKGTETLARVSQFIIDPFSQIHETEIGLDDGTVTL